MKRLFFTMTVLFLAGALTAGTVNYTADDSTIFPNPERGFITMLTGHLSAQSPYAVKGSESELRGKQSSEKMSIVLVHYYLENFRTTAQLPDAVLNGFDEDMQVLRNLGMKAIVRFSYAEGTYGSGKSESAKDASLEIVQQHLAQYKSHWESNSDVIFVFQAGIVGAWGEWYYSDHFGNQTSHMNESRRALLDTLLQTVPEDRCIQIRTPLFKTEYLGDATPLNETEAYSGSPKARLAHHNDAFLYMPDNMGTYSDTTKQKPYIAQETLYVPIGGETNIESASQAATEASYDVTIAEMSRLHWTFIQSGFSETVTNMWRQNGTFDELNRRLGYRLQLVSGTYGEEVPQGGKLSVSMQIRNTGFAPLYNKRTAYIVLRNNNYSYSLPLTSDPRTWLPNGVVSTVSENISIPKNIPAGSYQLYLYLPDAYSRLEEDPRYAVRLANTGVWEESTGMNALLAEVEVTESSDPEPVDPDAPVVLPATLNKKNVKAYSDNMSWYNTNYFDFGPEDAENIDRWAEWEVELRYPGKYIVSATGYYPNGHQWEIVLENTTTKYQFPASWAEGVQTETGESTWDLSNFSKGTYTLRVQNIMAWGQPKLKSLTLEYDGELPTDVESTDHPVLSPRTQKVLKDQMLYIRQGDKTYTPDGREIAE